MRGKYSPTVTAAYMADQEWWHRYSREAEEFTLYDPEGYDSYGYDVNGRDRAGWEEHVYYGNDADPDYDPDGDYNTRYDRLLDDWTFDGTKPVRR
jgi:hypothetical protein